jgi:beta-phosphoglucomutase
MPERRDHPWGVIFDMDGVLVDSHDAHFESWKRMLRNHGRDMTPEQFSATFGKTNRRILDELFDDLDRERIARWGDEKEAIYRDLLRENFPAMDGASELIRRLHEAGAKLAVGSSGPQENIEIVLEKLPEAEHVEAVTHGMEVEHGKPHPEVFLKAAEKLSLPPTRCVVIEDATAGVEAGRAAGCAVAALTGTAERDSLAQADLVVDSLHELDARQLQNLRGD